jgi:hypothetical protein
METKPNQFHCHSWPGTYIALKPNQTIFIDTAGQEQILHSNHETKPNHFIATAGQEQILH